jgi:hypothetical protein
MKSFGFAAILVSVCAAAACSSSDTDGSGGGGGSATTSSVTTTTTTTTTTATSSVTTTTSTGPQSCADLPADQCAECCGQEHATGFDVINNSYLTNCACADGAACVVECNTADAATDLCLDDGTFNFNVMNDACVTCLNDLTGMEACWDPIRTDCQAEPDCVDFIQCQNDCPQ